MIIASCSKGNGSRLTVPKGTKKCKARRKRRLLAARAFYYYAIGDGKRRRFTLEDALPDYDCALPDPSRMSLINVFVDGLLQSPELYGVYPGELLFVSNQPPPEGARIIAQFIALKG